MTLFSSLGRADLDLHFYLPTSVLCLFDAKCLRANVAGDEDL